MDVIQQLLLDGAGIGALPDRFAAEDVRLKRLVRDIAGMVFARRSRMGGHADAPLSARQDARLSCASRTVHREGLENPSEWMQVSHERSCARPEATIGEVQKCARKPRLAIRRLRYSGYCHRFRNPPLNIQLCNSSEAPASNSCRLAGDATPTEGSKVISQSMIPSQGMGRLRW